MYSPVAMSMPVLREAEHDPERGPVKTLKRGSFAAYSRAISSVLSLDVSTPRRHSQSEKGCFTTESRLSRRYCATSQHGTIIEKNGFIAEAVLDFCYLGYSPRIISFLPGSELSWSVSLEFIQPLGDVPSGLFKMPGVSSYAANHILSRRIAAFVE